MSYSHDEVEVRAARYAAEHDLVLEEQLGYGVHGVVWSASRSSATGFGELSAVKVHAPDRPYYARERDIYLRLRECGVTELRGFNVPRLVDFDDDLWVIEIDIVQPPSSSTSPARTSMSNPISPKRFWPIGGPPNKSNSRTAGRRSRGCSRPSGSTAST